eukprot:gene22253-29323_t
MMLKQSMGKHSLLQARVKTISARPFPSAVPIPSLIRPLVSPAIDRVRCFVKERAISDVTSEHYALLQEPLIPEKHVRWDWCPNRLPDPEVLEIWQAADAVCFDVDCTLVKNDGLDLLAEFMGVRDQVEAVMAKRLEGTISLDDSLDERLKILDCTPEDIKNFLKANPPETRINEGVVQLIQSLRARGVQVYALSAGFREILNPVAKYLGIPSSNVIANRMNWQWDDETGEPTKLMGFDMSEPTSSGSGKPEAIAKLRQTFPYNTIVMVGDGVTDLEAVNSEYGEGADLFIGYGGNLQRNEVMLGADWFIMHFDELFAALKRRKVAMVGAGAMACAAMHVMGQNLNGDDPAQLFDANVKMWLHDSEFEGEMLSDTITMTKMNLKYLPGGEMLSDTITMTKMNPKYLPGVTLGEKTVAEPNLLECVKDADIIIFCVPHQFIHGMCKKLVGKIKEDAIAISLTKGMRVRADGPQLVSQMIRK